MILSSFLVNCFQLALPLFSMLIYDKAIGNEVHDTLWALGLGMLLLFGMDILLRAGRVLLVEHAGNRWDTNLDERMMRGILSAPMSKNMPIGDILAKYREVSSTRDFLSAQFLLPLADLPFLIIFIVVIAAIGGPLVFVPLGMGLLLIALNTMFQFLGMHHHRKANEIQSSKMTRLVDILLARDSLMSNKAMTAAAALYRNPVMTGARAAARARLWIQMGQQIVPVVVSLASVILLIVGVFRVEAQALSVGGLISCNLLGSRMVSMMYSSAPLVKRWKEFTHALRELNSLIDFNTPALADKGDTPGAFASEGMRLDNVSFNYPNQERLILDKLNLHLKTGELVAVVGSSGAGKSTLLRLLAGHLSPTQGRLSYGGHLIDDDIKRRWLCSRISYKPQDPSFLGGTLAEIVAPGETGVSDEKLVAALRSAGAGVMLDRGEVGLNTLIGTNGGGLSGGQRQIVSLARVIYCGSELLIMDEPTLGLDRPAQEQVLRELRPLAQTRCVVVSTHATEVIQCADRVIVLERGRIVADAAPSRLLGDVPAPSA